MNPKITCNLFPNPPFDFELTAGYHTYFQDHYGTDSLVQGIYRRLLDLDGSLVLASVSSIGSIDSPCLEVELQGSELSLDLANQSISAVAPDGVRSYPTWNQTDIISRTEKMMDKIIHEFNF